MAPVPVLPSRRPSYNAGSAVPVKWNSRDDELGELELTSARYRIDNLSDALVVRDWTAIPTPDPAGTLTVPATLNGMFTTWRDRQLMQVTFELTDVNAAVRQFVEVYELAAVFQGA